MDWSALLSSPLSLAGFLAAGLAMHRTSRDALGAPTSPKARTRLRIGAAGAFVCAFAVAVSGGWVSLVGGVMVMFGAGAVSIAVFTWRPTTAATLLRTTAVVGVGCLLIAAWLSYHPQLGGL